MTDLARLTVALEAETAKFRRDIQQVSKKLSKFEKNTTKSVKKAGDSFFKLAAGIGAVSVAAQGLRKLVTIARATDILNAQLITATGSSAGAALAFERLEKFAARTPFALEQSVVAFQKLVNLGLTPSERALTSYGNTASALGKDLNQFIEAVADAATSEFERLKEFGIKAKNQGDTIRFTFQGVTTSIKNNAAEIEKYLINIGETSFAGAMEERAKTLDGAISNLGDSWDNLFRRIAGSGIGEAMAGQIRKATSVLDGFAAALSVISPSGQAGKLLSLQSELSQTRTNISSAGSGSARGRNKGQENLNKLLEREKTIIAEIGVIRKQQADLQAKTLADFKIKAEAEAEAAAKASSKKELAQFSFNPNDYGPQQFTAEQTQGLSDYNSKLLDLARNAPKTSQAIADMFMKTSNALADSIENQREETDRARENFDALFTQNLVQAAENGFDGILKSWAKTLQQMVAKALASKIFNLISGIGGGGEGSFGGFFTGLFGGGKASGGPVSPNKAYLVGERGPEMFLPPGRGRIAANDSFGGMSIVNNIDARGADLSVVPQIEAAVERAVAISTQKRIEAQRRGG